MSTQGEGRDLGALFRKASKTVIIANRVAQLHVDSVTAHATWTQPAEAKHRDQGPQIFVLEELFARLATAAPALRKLTLVNATMPRAALWASRWRATALVDALLRGASQVMFASNPVTGVILIAAMIAVDAQLALHGLLGLLGATLTAMALAMDANQIETGLFGYNGLLLGLGVGVYLAPAASSATVVSSGSIDVALLLSALWLGGLTSFVQLALGNMLVTTFRAVPLSLPFDVCTIMMMLVTPSFDALARASFLTPALPHEEEGAGAGAAAVAFEGAAGGAALAWVCRAALTSIAQIFFMESAVLGGVIILAVGISSRIAAITCAYGAVVGVLLATWMGAPAADIAAGLWCYNSALVAVLTITFNYPTLATGTVGVTLMVMFTLLIDAAMRAAMAPIGVPPGTIPFCTAGIVQFLTQGKTNLFEPIPIESIATPEDHMYSMDAAKRTDDDKVKAGSAVRGRLVLTNRLGTQTTLISNRVAATQSTAPAEDECSFGAAAVEESL